MDPGGEARNLRIVAFATHPAWRGRHSRNGTLLDRLLRNATHSHLEPLRAKGLGASDGIDYRTHPEWHEQVLALTNGRVVDHVVAVGGVGTLRRAVEATRVGGQVHLIGVLTGGEINPTPILRRNADVRGDERRDRAASNPSRDRKSPRVSTRRGRRIIT